MSSDSAGILLFLIFMSTCSTCVNVGEAERNLRLMNVKLEIIEKRLENGTE